MHRPSSHPPPRPDAGFTLVEALASLVVLGLFSLVLVAGLGGRTLVLRRGAAATDAAEHVEAAQTLLRDRLAHVWPETTYDFLRPRPRLDGDAGQFEWSAAPPAARDPGPLRRYRLSLTRGGDLVLQSRSELALSRQAWAQGEVLMRRVEALDLAYFGPAGSGGPAWRSDWLRQPTTPALIRVRLAFPEGDRRRWPDLLVHPVADIDTDCLVTAEGRCGNR